MSQLDNPQQYLTGGKISQWLKGLSPNQVLPPRGVLQVPYSENVLTLLNQLETTQLRCAVVVDSFGKVKGFVDALDVVYFILETLGWGKDIKTESYSNIFWKGQNFFSEGAGLLIDESGQDPYYFTSAFSTLYSIVQTLAQGVHRIAIVDNNTIKNVISQSDVVNLLVSRANFSGSIFEKSLIGSGLIPQDLIRNVKTVPQTATAQQALQFMKTNRYSGAPIVDDQGRLVCNFSATDIIHMKPAQFPALSLSVPDFISQIYGFIAPPVSIRPHDSVELLLYKFVAHKIHRIFVVDNQFKPIRVLTLTNVMQLLLQN